MALPRFKFVNAKSFADAVDLLKSSSGKAAVISGGTDLLHGFKDNIYREYPELIVNLRSADEANTIEGSGEGVRIGALTTLHALENNELLKKDYSVLAQAAYAVASPQIRNGSTIGGNICQQPRCWYYRNADGLFNCLRKGGSFCNAQTGHNEIHSIFGSMKVKETPCQEECPAGNAIPDYLARLRADDRDGAAEILLRTNPLAAVTGRICPHTCMEQCNRNNMDESVSIRAIERSVGDYILAHNRELAPAPTTHTGKRIAVVGSGPAGLSAAYFLRRQGHEVVVFDKMPKAGGMLRYGIPAYRLPKDVLDAQIAMLADMGIAFRMETEIGKQVLLKDLRKEYSAVFLGSGAWSPVSINLDGEAHTISAMQFLRDVAMGRHDKPGDNVVVIGGGNVAVDAAMTCRRLGAKKVTMVCLESRGEMPAFADDIREAEKENVIIDPSWGPDRMILSDGRVTGLEVVRCVSVRDKQGRFSPSYDRDTKKILEADSVILAVGQKTDLSYIEPELGIGGRVIAADSETQETKVAGLYAGGDTVTGPASVVKAVAAGHRAAFSIQKYLGGCASADPQASTSCGGLSCCSPSCLKTSRPAVMQTLPPSEQNIEKEDALGLDARQIETEISRCFNCGCVAASPSDLAPALIALDAVVQTTERVIDAENFFSVGIQTSTVLRPDELVREIRLPAADPDRRSSYLKFRQRKSIDFPLVSAAASVTSRGGRISDARIVMGAVAPVPVRAKEAEAFLLGKALTEETAAAAAEIAIKDARPLGKNGYKVQVAKVFVRRALLACR